jgi:hypothetical protein
VAVGRIAKTNISVIALDGRICRELEVNKDMSLHSLEYGMLGNRYELNYI